MLKTARLRCLEALIPGIAHEVNNHNQTILLSGQILQEIWDDLSRNAECFPAERADLSIAGLPCSTLRQEIPQCIANLLSGAARIERLIAELQAFSGPRNDDGPQILDLNRLIESSTVLLASLIRKSTDRFSMRLEPGLPAIRGHGRQIQQALIELLLIACRSLPDQNGEVGIQTCFDPRARRVICEVHGGGHNLQVPDWQVIRNIMDEHGAELDSGPNPAQCTRVIMKFIPETGHTQP